MNTYFPTIYNNQNQKNNELRLNGDISKLCFSTVVPIAKKILSELKGLACTSIFGQNECLQHLLWDELEELTL